MKKKAGLALKAGHQAQEQFNIGYYVRLLWGLLK